MIGTHRCGPDEPLLVIAGPCVIESLERCLQIADHLVELSQRLPIQVVFKASYDKANRTSVGSFRGPGIDEGLAVLDRVRQATGLPVTTDVHLPDEATAAGQVCDLLQIPAFLCRQTDILLAAAATGRAVNVNKGQFVAPGDMKHAVAKLMTGGLQRHPALRTGHLLRLRPARQRLQRTAGHASPGCAVDLRCDPLRPAAGQPVRGDWGRSHAR